MSLKLVRHAEDAREPPVVPILPDIPAQPAEPVRDDVCVALQSLYAADYIAKHCTTIPPSPDLVDAVDGAIERLESALAKLTRERWDAFNAPPPTTAPPVACAAWEVLRRAFAAHLMVALLVYHSG